MFISQLYKHLSHMSSVIPSPFLFSSKQILSECVRKRRNPNTTSSSLALPSAVESADNSVEEHALGNRPEKNIFMFHVQTQSQQLGRNDRGEADQLHAIKQLCERFNCTSDIFKGVTKVKEMVFLFNASVDGVQVHKNSKINNSVSVSSLFSCNITRRRAVANLDAFFSFVIPCDRAEKQNTSTSNVEVKVATLDSSGKTQLIDIPSNWTINEVDENWDSINIIRSNRKKGTPADKETRKLEALLLADIMENGMRGCFVRKDDTLYVWKSAVRAFCCDLVAGNNLLDSSGKLSSDSFCNVCTVTRRVLEPMMMNFVDNTNMSFSSYRRYMKTVDSALSGLPVDDLLRLLPNALFLQQSGVGIELFHNALRGELLSISGDNEWKDDVNTFFEEHYHKAMTVLSEFLSILPDGMAATLPPDDSESFEYIPRSDYQPPIEFKSTNAPDTEGVVDLGKNTVMPKSQCIATDLVHLIHSLSDTIINFLFKEKLVDMDQPNKGKGSTNRTINDDINNYRSFYGISNKKVNYFSLPPWVRERMAARYQKLKGIKKINIPFLSTLFSVETDSSESEAKPNIEEKMRFVFCVMPYLVIDCMSEPKVWILTSLSCLIGAFYTHTGSFKKSHELQVCIRCVRTLQENQFAPNFETPYFHNVDHFDKCYHVYGDLKSNDTLHGEGQFRGLAEEAKGGHEPAMTIFNRRNVQMMTCQLVVQLTDKIKVKVYSIEYFPPITMRFMPSTDSNQNRVQSQVNFLTNSPNIVKRAGINYFADLARMKNDLLPLPSFCDIEFCGGYTAYRSCTDHPEDQPLPGWENHFPLPFVSSDNVIDQFIEDYNLDDTIITPFDSQVRVVSSFTIDSIQYSSLGMLWSELTQQSFSTNAFAFFTTINGETRLLAVYKYLFFTTKGGNQYIQALVYEIPVRHFDPFGVSPYSFIIDLSQPRVNTSFTLVSFHRLEMQSVFVVPLSEDELYISPNVHLLRQYKIIKSLDFTTNE